MASPSTEQRPEMKQRSMTEYRIEVRASEVGILSANIVSFFEEILGERFESPLPDLIEDGVILCRCLQIVLGNKVPLKYNPKPKQLFHRNENLTCFVKNCERIGIRMKFDVSAVLSKGEISTAVFFISEFAKVAAKEGKVRHRTWMNDNHASPHPPPTGNSQSQTEPAKNTEAASPTQANPVTPKSRGMSLFGRFRNSMTPKASKTESNETDSPKPETAPTVSNPSIEIVESDSDSSQNEDESTTQEAHADSTAAESKQLDITGKEDASATDERETFIQRKQSLNEQFVDLSILMERMAKSQKELKVAEPEAQDSASSASASQKSFFGRLMSKPADKQSNQKPSLPRIVSVDVNQTFSQSTSQTSEVQQYEISDESKAVEPQITKDDEVVVENKDVDESNQQNEAINSPHDDGTGTVVSESENPKETSEQNASDNQIEQTSSPDSEKVEATIIPSNEQPAELTQDSQAAMEELMRREMYREKIVDEIVSTESDYVRDLHIIVEEFLEPILGENILTTTQINDIFGDIRPLYNLHTIIFEEFVKDKYSVGRVIVKYVAAFKIYSTYCAGYDSTLEVITKLRQTSPTFKKFLQGALEKEACRGLDLSSFLIKPVQRICKYPLLLRELLKYTPSDSPDYTEIEEALQLVNKCAAGVNQRVKELKNNERLLSITSRLEGCKTNLLTPTRRFITEAVVRKYSTNHGFQQRRIILFNDLILLVKDVKGHNYKWKESLNIQQNYGVREYEDPYNVLGEERHGFEIVQKSRTVMKDSYTTKLVLFTQTSAERAELMQLITFQISEMTGSNQQGMKEWKKKILNIPETQEAVGNRSSVISTGSLEGASATTLLHAASSYSTATGARRVLSRTGSVEVNAQKNTEGNDSESTSNTTTPTPTRVGSIAE